MEWMDILLSKFAPHVCVGCGQEGLILCADCGALLPDPPTREPIRGIDSVWAATIYDSFAKDLVWQLKFRGARESARVMAGYMALRIARAEDAVIVPVPTAPRRVRQRGFDQARLLARRLSRISGLRQQDSLRRYGQTHQVGASREQRLSQLKTAFRLKRSTDLQGRRIILVDDVLTTGATLEAAAAAIWSAGPRQIDAVVFAQAD